MSQINRKDFITEVFQYIEKNRIFDLVSVANGNEVVFSNLGKIQKTLDGLCFFEKDCFGFWQKVPFLKAPLTILDRNGVPLCDSEEIKNPEFINKWISDCVFEVVRHVVQHFFSYGSRSTAYEFLLIKEIVQKIKGDNMFSDQQLLNSDSSVRAACVLKFHQTTKKLLMDSDLAECVSKIRDNVTLFEYTFSLPNKESFIHHGQNWVSLLPSLAKTQTECLLLSKNGQYVDTCSNWVEVLEDEVEWGIDVNPKLNEYIKHIPVASLRALIGRNISHSIAIMQLAKIKPNAPVGLFNYIGKVLNKKDIDADSYDIYACCLSKIINYISSKLTNEFNTILDVCYSSQVFELLLAHYSNGDISDCSTEFVFETVSLSIASSVKADFEKLVVDGELDIYTLQEGSQADFIAALKYAKNSEEFKLYEKCLFLVGDTNCHRSESNDLEWWYFHVGDYRILISRIANNGDICNIYSIDGCLTEVEVNAVQKIMIKISNENKKTS